MKGVRHDTGNKLGYLKAVVYFALRRPDLADKFSDYLSSLDLEAPAVTRKSARRVQLADAAARTASIRRYELFEGVVPDDDDELSPDEVLFELSEAFSVLSLFSVLSDFSAFSDFSDFSDLSDFSNDPSIPTRPSLPPSRRWIFPAP